jgi:acetyl esterase/lipase
MSATVEPRFPLWPGQPPGSEGWNRPEVVSRMPSDGLRVLRNVTVPTLEPHLPPLEIATGTAVIVCPGGAYHFLADDHEGAQVAAWLNARGVAAFVLRYRVQPTAADDAEFLAELQAHMADRAEMERILAVVQPLAIADGQQALRMVRGGAERWGLRPDRIGIMGFSAGGMLTTAVATLYDAETRPDFAAPIYGAPWALPEIPGDAPPVFIAVAGDDRFAQLVCVPLYSAWAAAGRPAELHVYDRGGHGFGMIRQGAPSDSWIERMGDWMGALGLLRPA